MPISELMRTLGQHTIPGDTSDKNSVAYDESFGDNYQDTNEPITMRNVNKQFKSLKKEDVAMGLFAPDSLFGSGS